MSTSRARIPSAEQLQCNRNAAYQSLREMVLKSVAPEHFKRNYFQTIGRGFTLCANRGWSASMRNQRSLSLWIGIVASVGRQLCSSLLHNLHSAIKREVGWQ